MGVIKGEVDLEGKGFYGAESGECHAVRFDLASRQS